MSLSFDLWNFLGLLFVKLSKPALPFIEMAAGAVARFLLLRIAAHGGRLHANRRREAQQTQICHNDQPLMPYLLQASR
jgi:hypothetical protein